MIHQIMIKLCALGFVGLLLFSPLALADCDDMADEIKSLKASVIEAAFTAEIANLTIQTINRYRAQSEISSFQSDLLAESTEQVSLNVQRKRQQQTRLDQMTAQYEQECTDVDR